MLAAFAASPTGRLYGRSCERYGVDPGYILSDDVMALNLRIALALSDQGQEEAEELVRGDPEPIRGNPGLYEQMKASSGV